jgi:hypothetical protein
MFEKLKEYSIYIVLSVIWMLVLVILFNDTRNEDVWNTFKWDILNTIVQQKKEDKNTKNAYNYFSKILNKYYDKFNPYKLNTNEIIYLNWYNYKTFFNGEKIFWINHLFDNNELKLIIVPKDVQEIDWATYTIFKEVTAKYWDTEQDINYYKELNNQQRWLNNYWWFCLWTFEKEEDVIKFIEKYFSSASYFKILWWWYIACFMLWLENN